MSLDKEQLQALLADYVEGSLSERQIDEAEAYLAANPAVRTVVDRLMIDSEALRALPRQRAGVDFSEDFRAQAERDLLLGDAVSATRKTPSFGGPMLALAAMLAIGLGLGGAGYYLLAYRPATNLEFAKVAARHVAAPTDASAGPGRDASIAPGRDAPIAEVAPPTSEPTVASSSSSPPPMTADAAPATPATPAPAAMAGGASRREDDGKAWDRVFAAKPAGVEARADDAMSAPRQAEASPQDGERASLPDDVRSAIAARASPRGAVVIVVDDPATLDATRSLVRAAIVESFENVAAAKASNRAETGGIGIGGGGGGAALAPTAGPAGEVASDVPASAASRVRALFGDGATAVRLYDVPPTTRPAADEAQQSMQQQASGVYRERADAATVDVYVVARPAGTTRATAP